MVPGYHRPAVVKVNLGAIRRNIKNEMKHLATGQKMLAVVKAPQRHPWHTTGYGCLRDQSADPGYRYLHWQ